MLRPSQRRLLCLAFLAPLSTAHAGDLMNLYTLAQQQDQTLQAAMHQRDASVEAHPQALAALLPQISGTAEIDRNRQHLLSGYSSTASTTSSSPSDTAYYNNKTWGLNLAQTVFNWPAFQTLAKSDLQVAQAQATYRAAEQDLIYRVADAYFSVLNAQDTLRADMDAQTAYKRQLDEAQKKFEVGLAAITDVRNAQASYDSAAATVIVDQRALDSARRTLGQIVGQHMPEVAQLQDELPLIAPTPDNEDAWVKAAAEDNPTLISYRYAAEAAQKDVRIARSQWLPSVAIVGSAGRQIQDYTTGQDVINDSIGLQMNWKIFQGGLVASQTRQASASYEQAEAQYEGQRRAADQSARDAFEGVRSGIASVKASQQAVVSNQTSLEATKVGLKVGTRTEVDVLNAQQALAAAQRTYYQSRYDYLRSVLALKQSAGRLSEPDLEQIDQMLLTR